VLFATLFLVPFGVGLYLFGRYVCDDDLIMLRYAQRLADGKGMTWNDGERVHGVSAMLLVLLSAGLRLVGVPLEVTMRVLSATGVLAAGLCLVYASRRSGVSRWASWALGGSLTLFAPFAVWAFAGVGGVVFAAVTGWAAVLATDGPFSGDASPGSHRRRMRWMVFLLCLLQLVRPDALVVALPVLAVAFLAHPRGDGYGTPWAFLRRSALPVLGFGALFAAAQQWYFATPVPHLAGVKLVPGLGLMRIGVLYTLEFVRGFFPLLLAAPVLLVVGILLRSRSSEVSSPRRVPLIALFGPLLPAAVWCAYVVWVGGDWMPGNRHFAVALLLLMVTLVRVAASAGPRFASRALVASLLAVSAVTATVSVKAPAAWRARTSVQWFDFICDGAVALRTAVGDLDPLLAIEPAGCIPYYTEFRSVDMLGLTDLHISKATPTGRPVMLDELIAMRRFDPDDPRIGQHFIAGHGNGDGAYVWRREPDLIVSCEPMEPSGTGCFRSWFEMHESFDYESRYRLLSVDVGKVFPWNGWVRHDAGPLGVRRDVVDGRLVRVFFPPWLLTNRNRAMLVADPDGPAKVALRADAVVETSPVALDRGTWSLGGLPAGVRAESLAGCASFTGGQFTVVSDACPVVVRLTASSPVALTGLSLQRPES
jgi:arabinofuranosyltransferase